MAGRGFIIRSALRCAFVDHSAAHSLIRSVLPGCADSATLQLIAEDPDGDALEPRDRAVYRFARKVVTDAASIERADVDELRTLGLADADIVSVVYAVGARPFSTRDPDGLGVQVDPQTDQAFDGALLASMIVGRRVPALIPHDWGRRQGHLHHRSMEVAVPVRHLTGLGKPRARRQ